MVPDAVKGSPASEARQQSQAVGGTKQRDADRGEWRGGGRGGEGEKGEDEREGEEACRMLWKQEANQWMGSSLKGLRTMTWQRKGGCAEEKVPMMGQRIGDACWPTRRV